MTEEYKINFIKDEPTENSDFSAHANTSNTIYEIIRDDKQGKSIALFGSWGSGKSTVIKNIINKKTPEDNIDVFEFDAWEHSNSPIKRAFLEELLKFLKFKPKTTKKIKKKVDDREHSLEVRDKPRFGVLTIILTVIYAFTLKLIDHQTELDLNNYVMYLLGLWPVAIFIFFLIFKLDVKFNNGSNDGKERITRTSEPSGIEFKEYFKHIMAQYGKEKKLVIVIDNLDRVPEEKAENILSNLSSFTCNGYKNVWSIIPIDKNHALKLWGKYQNKENFDVNSFIEKLFNLKFYLNHAIHSDAKSYFNEKLSNAFEVPKLTEEEKNTIYDIYSSEYDSNGKSIRKMLTYINDLASLFLLHPTINIKTLALYCKKKESFSGANDFKALFNSQKNETDDIGQEYKNQNYDKVSLHQLNLINNDKNFPADFASIFFGVERDNALHCLYGSLIEHKLKQGIFDNSLKEIVNHYGFVDSLSYEVQKLKNYSFDDIKILFNTIFVLSKIEELIEKDKAKFNRIWKKIDSDIEVSKLSNIDNIDDIIFGLDNFLNKNKNNIKIIKKIYETLLPSLNTIGTITMNKELVTKMLELIQKYDADYQIEKSA